MKSIAMPGTVQLSKEIKDQLTSASEVQEKLAINASNSFPSRKMTVADMWDLQRRGRTASGMIRRWTLN
jgi:hypothetical protein